MVKNFYTYLLGIKDSNECKDSVNDNVSSICRIGKDGAYGLPNDATSIVSEFYSTEDSKKLISDIRENGKVNLVGSPISSDEDAINVARLATSDGIDTARWVFVKNGIVVHQSIVSIGFNGHYTRFSFNDIMDQRCPVDCTWLVRDADRWNGSDSIYLAICGKGVLDKASASGFSDLAGKLALGDTETGDDEFWISRFKGIVLTNKDRFTSVRKDGTIVADIGIVGNIFANQADLDELVSVERNVAIVASMDCGLGSSALLITTDNENQITGMATISSVPFSSISLNSKISLINRFLSSNSASKCFIFYDSDVADSFKYDVARMLKRELFSGAFMRMDGDFVKVVIA